MSNNVTLELNRILKLISQDNFVESDIKSLFVILRTLKTNKTIVDIANFYTHAEGRDQGLSHAMVQKWVNNFISVAESSGGTIYGIHPVFTHKGVINELLRTLRATGARYTESDIKRNSVQIINYVKSMVVEGEFHLDDSRVTRCWVSRDKKDKLMVNFQASGLAPGCIILGAGATIAGAFFD
jgi:hypothetical protein